MSEKVQIGERPAAVQHETAEALAIKYKDRIAGKTIVITGVSPDSLGAAFVEAVVQASPAMVVVASTSLERMSEVVEIARTKAPSVTFATVQLDLASQASVRRAAAEIDGLVAKIDALVLNAGVMAMPYGLTEDGIERQFGINHVGHFLFANLLMPKVLAAGEGSRVVVVSSDGHRFTPVVFDDLTWDNGRSYHPMKGYGSSKSANALFAVELARRLKPRGIQSYSLQPGLVVTGKMVDGKLSSGLARHFTDELRKEVGMTLHPSGNGAWTIPEYEHAMKTLPQGAATHVYAAFDPDIVESSGSYLRDVAVARENVETWAKDPEAAKRLWAVSEELVGQEFDL